MLSLASRVARMWMLVRMRPFDIGTAEGRAEERHRRVALSALASALAKILSVSTALISVPLTLHYLGPERYGMWMAMSSLIAMLGFADLGVGNGVLTAVATAHGNDDREAIRRYVSSGLFVLTGISIAILAAFALCYPFVPWHRLFNVSGALALGEAAPALAMFVICFALAIPAGIVQRTQLGLQQGFLASLWQCGASASGLLGVLLAIHFEAGLPWLVLAFAGAPLLALLLNSLLFFGRLQADIAPRRASVSRAAMGQIVRTGSLFLVLQIVGSVTYASDPIIIAQLMGADAIPAYTVPERMFGVVSLLVAMLVAPLWPAYSEAIARGDTAWVRATLKKSLLVALAFGSSASLSLVILGPWLILHWVGNAIQPSVALLASFALWKCVESFANAFAAFLNGAQLLKYQAVTAVVTAIVAISLKLSLGHLIGLPGLLLGTSIAWLTCTGIPWFIYLRKSHHLQLRVC